jgi:hypothetical protein
MARDETALEDAASAPVFPLPTSKSISATDPSTVNVPEALLDEELLLLSGRLRHGKSVRQGT